MRNGDNSGVAAHPSLSGPLRVGPPGGLPVPLQVNLLVEQKAALGGFLNYLTDITVTTDAKFQDPFEYGH